MSGNVWEWTRSLWGTNWSDPEFTYPYDPEDKTHEDLAAGDDVMRVVRGGSWLNSSDLARCACRGGNLPGDRNFGLGFRVVLRSAPVDSDL
jgi:formylglycine-generating enzyme required for sulfatase activity